MKPQTDRAAYLADKWLKNTITPEEELEFHTWYREDLHKPVHLPAAFASSEEEHRKRILKAIKSQIDPPARKLWPAIAAAASLFLVLTAGLLYYTNPNQSDKQQAAVQNAPNILPGRTGATLTLANGRKISLAGTGKGEIAKEAGVTISKSKEGQLLYEAGPAVASHNQINTLTTANGETYQLLLPDGSTVYLNAASTLTYGTTLRDDRGIRRVRLEGEAYFEIAKDKTHPFIVATNRQEVEVLGTHFNISNYANDPGSKTTLLEGSIRLNRHTMLKPGQQAEVALSGRISVTEVDADNAVAWKNGYFQFDGEDLESIMRKVSRWYDVEIVYEDEQLKRLGFAGTVSRYKSVVQVLKTLQMTNALNFKVSGRTIVISSEIRKNDLKP